MLLTAEHLYKNYGSRQLFSDATLYLNAGDKVGLIGVNGQCRRGPRRAREQ